MIDKTFTTNYAVGTSVAVCPNYGKVETYLNEDALSDFQDACYNILKD